MMFSLAMVSLAMMAAKPVKNVIFMIGDGMGLNQAYAAAMVKGEPLLFMFEAEAVALQETYSADSKITDSAASGTALACGVKTNNGMIGMDADSVSVESILKMAADRGKATGIVVTCQLFHATPAAFFAHNISRKNYEAIAKDMLTFSPDVMIGGGAKYLKNRKDGCHLEEGLQAQGKRVLYRMDDVKAALKNSDVPVLGFLADEHMPAATAGRGDFLPQAVSLALDRLSRDKDGFFLMVEGSQVDFSSHDNDVNGTVAEALDFEKALAVALDFAKKHKNTLVVVTADHETGGLSLLQKTVYQEETGLKHQFTTTDHTGVPVPVYLYGAGADAYPAFMQNSDHKELLVKLMKLK